MVRASTALCVNLSFLRNPFPCSCDRHQTYIRTADDTELAGLMHAEIAMLAPSMTCPCLLSVWCGVESCTGLAPAHVPFSFCDARSRNEGCGVWVLRMSAIISYVLAQGSQLRLLLFPRVAMVLSRVTAVGARSPRSTLTSFIFIHLGDCVAQQCSQFIWGLGPWPHHALAGSLIHFLIHLS